MKALKNIFVGFVVSFVGSIPLGYLNVIGLEIYSKLGMDSLIFFLLGVVFVEVFVVYFTLIFSKPLVSNKKLMKIIDFFAVLFLFILGYSFYASANQPINQQGILDKYAMYSPFLIGVFLNCINFLQLPFWTGWNLYLMNGNYISIVNKLKLYYVSGTSIGTFFGMMTLILMLNSLSQNTIGFSKYLIPVVIPSFFVILALLQMVKVYNKYGRDKTIL